MTSNLPLLIHSAITLSARKFNITGATQIHTILYLHEHGKATHKELADQCRISSAAMTGTIDRLVNFGLVICERGKDRRTYASSLSPKGQEMFGEIEHSVLSSISKHSPHWQTPAPKLKNPIKYYKNREITKSILKELSRLQSMVNSIH